MSPRRAATRPTVCGVRPISGTSRIAVAAALERRLDRREVDLRLAGAGDAVQEPLATAPSPSIAAISASAQARWAAESSARRATAPTVSIRGARRTSRTRRSTQPALGQRRAGPSRVGSGQLADPRPGELARRRRGARAPRAAARRAARPSVAPSARSPASVIRARALGQRPHRPRLASRSRSPAAGRARVRAAASSSSARRPRGRAEQLRAWPPPRSPRAARRAAPAAARSRSATPTTTPSIRRLAKGTISSDPTPTPAATIASGQPVVEGALAAPSSSSSARPSRSASERRSYVLSRTLGSRYMLRPWR